MVYLSAYQEYMKARVAQRIKEMEEEEEEEEEGRKCCSAAQTPATEPASGRFRRQLQVGKLRRNAAISERCYLAPGRSRLFAQQI